MFNAKFFQRNREQTKVSSICMQIVNTQRQIEHAKKYDLTNKRLNELSSPGTHDDLHARGSETDSSCDTHILTERKMDEQPGNQIAPLKR